jgi:2-oxoglutarate ferredoxin oxidoreductase subunit delta
VEQKDWESCTGCTSCAIVCPDGCISVYRVKS